MYGIVFNNPFRTTFHSAFRALYVLQYEYTAVSIGFKVFIDYRTLHSYSNDNK